MYATIIRYATGYSHAESIDQPGNDGSDAVGRQVAPGVVAIPAKVARSSSHFTGVLGQLVNHTEARDEGVERDQLNPPT